MSDEQDQKNYKEIKHSQELPGWLEEEEESGTVVHLTGTRDLILDDFNCELRFSN